MLGHLSAFRNQVADRLGKRPACVARRTCFLIARPADHYRHKIALLHPHHIRPGILRSRWRRTVVETANLFVGAAHTSVPLRRDRLVDIRQSNMSGGWANGNGFHI